MDGYTFTYILYKFDYADAYLSKQHFKSTTAFTAKEDDKYK